MFINSYHFGRISICQKTYTRDVIIFPDRVRANWWRKEGHLLQLEDLEDAVEQAKPDIVVVGRGKFGVMSVSPEVMAFLGNNNIVLHAEKSDKAVEIFNQCTRSGKRVLGAFHLSC